MIDDIQELLAEHGLDSAELVDDLAHLVAVQSMIQSGEAMRKIIRSMPVDSAASAALQRVILGDETPVRKLAQPAPIQDLDRQLRSPLHQCDNPPDLILRQNHRNMATLPRPERVDSLIQGNSQDSLVQKHQCVHCLILCGRRNLALHRQMRQKRLNLRASAL
jgi:hypothetical protein